MQLQKGECVKILTHSLRSDQPRTSHNKWCITKQTDTENWGADNLQMNWSDRKLSKLTSNLLIIGDDQWIMDEEFKPNVIDYLLMLLITHRWPRVWGFVSSRLYGVFPYYSRLFHKVRLPFMQANEAIRLNQFFSRKVACFSANGLLSMFRSTQRRFRSTVYLTL